MSRFAVIILLSAAAWHGVFPFSFWAGLKPDPSGANIFVDSVAGSDTNSGLSNTAPKQTLAAAQTLAGTTSSPVVGLKRGSTWHEQFTAPASDISIVPYGTAGAPPIIDGADIVATTWTQPNVGSYPNVWSISWTRTGPVVGTDLLGLWADGARPRLASSVADLQTNGGWYATDRNTASAVTVYVKSATDPNSSGVVYKISKRNHCIYSYDSGFTTTLVGPVELTSGVAHYGSLSMGLGTVKNVLLRDGGIHHTVTQGSLTEDCIAAEYDPSVAGIPFTAYRATGAGFTHTFNRCLALFAGGASRNTTGTTGAFYAHSSSVIDALTISASAAKGIDFGSGAATSLTITNCYNEDPYVAGVTLTGATSTVTNYLHRETVASLNTGGSVALRQSGAVTSTISHAAVYAPGIQQSAGTIAITSSTFVSPASAVSSSGSTLSVNYSVIASTDYQISAVPGYSGNHNIFLASATAATEFRCFYNSVLKSTLSAWQTATSQDANSAYCALVDQYEGSAYALWLGVSEGTSTGPADGDFRINPNARVYSGAGTAYIGTFPDGVALTLAGAQQHYNWTARTVDSGPPTAWPTFPATIAEMRTYLSDPTAWAFYPIATGGTHDLNFVTASYQFNGVAQASWAAYLAASGASFARASSAYDTAASTSYAAGAARIDALGLLYERGTFNYLQKSATFDTWSGGLTVSANSVTAPDGTMTADFVTVPSNGTQFQTMNPFTAGVNWAFSTYAQKHASGSPTNTRLFANNNAAWATSDYTGASALSASWARVSQTGRPTTTGTQLKIGVGALNATNGNNDATCVGNVDFWGAQLEPGTTVTSYVPTTTSIAERKADRLMLPLGTTSRTITITFDDNSTQTLTGKTGNYTIPAPSLNRPQIKRIVVQ